MGDVFPAEEGAALGGSSGLSGSAGRPAARPLGTFRMRGIESAVPLVEVLPAAMTAEEAPRVVDIVRELDGVALAIELAAARTGRLPRKVFSSDVRGALRLLERMLSQPISYCRA